MQNRQEENHLHHQENSECAFDDIPKLGTPDRYDVEETGAPVRVGGRKSALAVVQSRHVADKLRNVHPGLAFPVIALKTLGDNVQNKPLYSFGGKALWTKELEYLLLHQVPGFDQLDMIVHSLKDMPTELPDGCALGAIPERHDPRDALCVSTQYDYKNLDELPMGAVIGTSSIRRQAQLRRKYPNLVFESVRGTLQTRLSKCDDPNTPYTAIILAAAGLERVNLSHRITDYLDGPDMYYAVGQGALGIEIREGDKRIEALVSRIDHEPTHLRCRAERSLMRALEGGCSVPIGVRTKFDAETRMLSLEAMVVSVDGKDSVHGNISSKVISYEDADVVGINLADELRSKGAQSILDAINIDRIY
ncbi:hydroxymethylbilane synthase [Starmerella bacillaris]|uniref:Porphobilinogen deaminase n=1 Tax=Starmerella bacillaris TaxID=1247836 RepID=A0AAV5RJV5_STABA|nr:hydroxymethylbilane synthase [Starmerella bacillaris]